MCYFFRKKIAFINSKNILFNLNKGWRAKFKASAGHIWPAGRMLCMPGVDCLEVKSIVIDRFNYKEISSLRYSNSSSFSVFHVT